MSKPSRKTTSAILLMLVFAMISSFPEEAEAGNVAISWPKFFWCFPDCVIGETCFIKVYRYCERNVQDVSIFNCIVVALEWCDLMFYDINLILPPTPPPHLNYNGHNETGVSKKAALE